LARSRFPGSPVNLDALCRRFAIDLSDRVEHGAEIDCRLLAAVYLELLGGRQPGLDFALPALLPSMPPGSRDHHVRMHLHRKNSPLTWPC
jgi:DNA polymerase III epsilon subunit-like protein